MAWMYRKTCMERLWALKGTRGIKVITALLRPGKSELMKAFSASIAREGPSSNNVYIDPLDLDNELSFLHRNGAISLSFHFLSPAISFFISVL